MWRKLHTAHTNEIAITSHPNAWSKRIDGGINTIAKPQHDTGFCVTAGRDVTRIHHLICGVAHGSQELSGKSFGGRAMDAN